VCQQAMMMAMNENENGERDQRPMLKIRKSHFLEAPGNRFEDDVLRITRTLES
jgi:hypothetical protein